MLKKLIWSDMWQNKLLSIATVFFMAVSAMMLALTALLFSSLLGSVNGLMEQAQAPDLVQMHNDDSFRIRIFFISFFQCLRGHIPCIPL